MTQKLIYILLGLAWMLAPLCYANKYEDWKKSVVMIVVEGEGLTWNGSGFIVDDEQGHIITAAHVLADANSVYIQFDNNLLASANAWKIYTESDVGILRVDPNMCVDSLPDFATAQLGMDVCIIGTPFLPDFRNSLSFGKVTGKRHLNGFDCYFWQTDGAINPGNSGGPVLDMEGRVLGISSMIFSKNGVFCGIALFVPSEYIVLNYVDFDRGY